MAQFCLATGLDVPNSEGIPDVSKTGRHPTTIPEQVRNRSTFLLVSKTEERAKTTPLLQAKKTRGFKIDLVQSYLRGPRHGVLQIKLYLLPALSFINI